MKRYLLVLSLSCSFWGFNQVADKTYSKIVIEEEMSPERALEIQDQFMKIPGMSIFRMDNFTHVLFVVYNNKENLVNETIISQLNALGYRIACYYTDQFEPGKTVELTIKNCQ